VHAEESDPNLHPLLYKLPEASGSLLNPLFKLARAFPDLTVRRRID